MSYSPRTRYVYWIQRETVAGVSRLTDSIVKHGLHERSDEEATAMLTSWVQEVFPGWQLCGWATQLVLPNEPNVRIAE